MLESIQEQIAFARVRLLQRILANFHELGVFYPSSLKSVGFVWSPV